MDFMSIHLIEDSPQPKYMQLFQGIKEMIIKGELKEGERLPSVRAVAKELNINTVTVVNSYKQLESNNFAKARKGSGYYVSKVNIENNNKKYIYIDKDEGYINLASAVPHPEIFPVDAFKNCINEVIERDKSYAFGYQEVMGFLPLREEFTKFLKEEHLIASNPENIQIVSGAQQGIDLISKVLITPGDYVITENPTYDGAIEAFSNRGGRIVGCHVEEDGINLIELEKKIRICNPKFLYIMTKYQNPTTFCYSEEKLRALLALAEKYNFYIVEDDSMSELNYIDKNITSLKAIDTKDRVIYIKSFSKLLMPGIRMGFLLIPKDLLKEVVRLKQSSDISSTGLMQRALHLYFKKDKWKEHIKYIKQIYKGKYEVMLYSLEKLKKYNISFKEPKGGLYFWVKLPKGISAKELEEKSMKKGLLILASDIFYPNINKDKDSYVRLSFAAAEVEEIKRGMTILGEIIKEIKK